MKRLIALFLAIWLTLPAVRSATVYCASSGAGSGADWSNVKSIYTYTMHAGDTVWMEGGAYATALPDVTQAGITFRRATISNHGTATGWNDSFDQQITYTGTAPAWYIGAQNTTIDGQTGGTNILTGMTDTYGISLTSTSTGTADGQSVIACRGQNVSHLRLFHVELIAPVSAGSTVNTYYAFEERTNVYGSTVSTDVMLQYIHMKGGLCNMVLTGNGTTDQSDLLDHVYMEEAGNQQHSEALQLANTKNIEADYCWFADIHDPSTTFIEPQQNGGNQPDGFKAYGCLFTMSKSDVGTQNATVCSMTGGEVCTNFTFGQCTMFGLIAPLSSGNGDTGINLDSGTAHSTLGIVKNCLWQNSSTVPLTNGGPGITGTGITQASNRLNTGTAASFLNSGALDLRLAADTTAIASRSTLPAGLEGKVDAFGNAITTSLGAFQFEATTSAPNQSLKPFAQTGPTF